MPRGTFERLAASHPRLIRALWSDAFVAASIQREWIVSLGQRSAYERVAHLFCEVFIRLQTVGLVEGDSCEFPVTQTELGDATGLSTVHVNRTLQDLRAAGLIVLKGRTLHIPDLPALKRAALFNPRYLHLGRDGRDPLASVG